MLSDPYQGPVPAVPVLGVGRIRVSSEVLSEGAMASFQLSHLSLRHRGSPVSLPHNSSLICDCSIPPPEPTPRVGYKSLLHRLEDREAHRHRCEHTDANTKANTGTSSSKPEPRGMCIWGAKRGSI